MTFNNWLDTFIDEKGFDLEEVFAVEGDSGTNWIPLGVVVEHMKITSFSEQMYIKTMIMKLDYINADVRLYMRHLAKAIAK